MKKTLLSAFVAISVLSLSACDFINKFVDGSGSSNGGSETSAIDTTIYGTGGANVSLVVGTNIPAGEYVAFFNAPENQPEGNPIEGGFVGVYSGIVSSEHAIWEDDFETTSMCRLFEGDVVNLKYATLQNIEANPKIGELKNGTFKVGTHFQTGPNGTVKVRALGKNESIFNAPVGSATFRSSLMNVDYYMDNPNWMGFNSLVEDEEKEFIYVPDGIYLQLDSAEIVLS